MTAASVLALFRARRWTLAAAESLTGGLLLARLTAVPGASDVVRGGLVVYATDLKHTLAGVQSELLERVGPVDAAVAHELARGVRARCTADVGIALTGVAGPGTQHGHPVGTVYVACCSPIEESIATLPVIPGASRTSIRDRAVTAALDLLRAAAESRSPTADTASPGAVGGSE